MHDGVLPGGANIQTKVQTALAFCATLSKVDSSRFVPVLQLLDFLCGQIGKSCGEEDIMVQLWDQFGEQQQTTYPTNALVNLPEEYCCVLCKKYTAQLNVRDYR